jgi:putative addiction module component (TIGR02574 family)
MSLDEIAREMLKRPLEDQYQLAQVLWDNLADYRPKTERTDAEWIEIARKRAEELESGKVKGVSHEEAMRRARAAYECE